MGWVNHDCDVRPEDAGPYLLGQLDPSHAEQVREQVARCPACRLEFGDLSAVVTALEAGTPPPDELDGPPQPSDGGLPQVLAVVRRHRRGRRLRVAGLAAAAVVVVAGVGLGPGLLSDQPAGVVLSGEAGAAGQARLAGETWGTAVRLEVSGLDPGVVYGVWLARADGTRSSAGTFRPGDDGAAQLSLSVGLPLDAGTTVGVSRLPAKPGGDVVDVLTAPVDRGA